MPVCPREASLLGEGGQAHENRSTRLAVTTLSSIHFKTVKNNNIAFEASHAFRTELSEPSYLLPEEVRLGNFSVKGSLTEKELVERFSVSLGKLSGAAKARNLCPFWHGVMVLDKKREDESTEDYKNRIEKSLLNWRKEFELKTETKVLSINVHLDEGHFHADHEMPVYNAHAHVFVDRVITEKVVLWGKERERNRLYSPGRKEMSEIQDLTAEAMSMTRGESLTDRNGKRGRKHIKSGDYRNLKQSEQHLQFELSDTKTKLQESLIRENNNLIRGFLKGAKPKGIKPSDWSAVKNLKQDLPLMQKICGLIEQDALDANDLVSLLRSQRWHELDELVLLRPELARSACLGDFGGDGLAPHLQEGYTYPPLRRWSVDDRDLYLLPERVDGKRLAFEDHGDRISVKIESDEVLQKALALAARKWPDGITIRGSDEFIQRCEQICANAGIKVLASSSNYEHDNSRF